MSSKMLIDASHPEETRVVVLKGHRVEEFDFESATKKQLRGNIYLAKVTRVEPSLQAAFIEYGGNRHGFLAFSEIHPDYYQIPYADRQALLEDEARAHRDEDDDPRGGESRGGAEARSGAEARGGAETRESRGTEAREGRGGEGRGGGGEGRNGEHRGGESRNEGREGRGGHRRSRRHRRDNAVSALDRRGSAGPFVSEPVPSGEESARETVEAWEDVPPRSTGHDDQRSEAASEIHDGDTPAGHFPPEDFDAAAVSAETIPVDAAGEDESQATEASRPSPHDDHPADEAPGAPALADQQRAPVEDAAFEFPPEEEEDDETDEPHAEARDFETHDAEAHDAEAHEPEDEGDHPAGPVRDRQHNIHERGAEEGEEEVVEQIGGDALEEAVQRAPRPRRHHYKIQEVIKRRQILLIQVVKEERGNKGAALTTYLSLAGRYSVLMPNTARGGGISRKITDADDRKRLKAIAQDLEVPEGMGVILRTAGAARSKIEVKRDFEYLLRMWESVRELTLRSTAPTLVYEEGSLIKRSIRDLYSKDIEDVIVSGEEGFNEAREFMRMLMPSAAKSVQLYRDPQPIFAKSGAEAQLDAMFSNHVTLKSGGYLVINQTEALVAIDVNSGRSTREHNIEDTAIRTNLEAADEIARQLRLRDLAGLIVVDFIDMEESRNNRSVERRIKEALKNDRARIQIGRISHFGLLEMSRQRMRTGVLEGSTVICPHCAGSGTMRSTASIALHVLRLLEDFLIRDASHNPIIRTRNEVALYILNQKRANLIDLELRFGVTITVAADHTLTGMVYHAIERGDPATPVALLLPTPGLVRVDSIPPIFDDSVETGEDEGEDGEDDIAEGETGEPNGEREFSPGETNADGSRRRKRRRRRRGRDRESSGDIAPDAPQPSDEGLATMAMIGGDLTGPAPQRVAFAEKVEVADEPVAVEPQAERIEVPSEENDEARAEHLASATESRDAAPVPEAEPVPVAEAVVEETEVTASAVEDTAIETVEPPRRRRPRRGAKVDEKIVPDEKAAVEAAEGESEVPVEDTGPSPRRSRRAPRARAADASPAVISEPKDAIVALPAEAASGPAGETPVEAKSGDTERPVGESPAAAEAMEGEAPRQTAETTSAPPVEDLDPNRPKRSGWWQRAKASFGS